MFVKSVSPILFIVFNRYETTRRVFEAIKGAKPKKLYISSDGPRPEKEGEAAKVRLIRQFLLEGIDWDCDVKTLFHETNQGCKYAPQKAITWFFENEKKGIVLEDDCLPSVSFFDYADELLERYENDFRVFGVTGTNFQSEKFQLKHSYYFSRFFMTWGWASWATRWQSHLQILEKFEKYLEDPAIEKVLKNKVASQVLIKYAKKGYYDELDAWDYQWILSCAINNGLIATSSKNLIQNIGFGEEATHTTNGFNRSKQIEPLNFPLKHPIIIAANQKIDDSFYKEIQLWRSTFQKYADPVFLRNAIMIKTKMLLKRFGAIS